MLKITDNTTVRSQLLQVRRELIDPQCLKFKTYSSIFLNRFEALNLALMQKMQNKQRPTSLPAASTSTPGAIAPEGIEPAVASPAVQGGGGVKKKKPKKKK